MDLEKVENLIGTIEKCLDAIRREVRSGRPQIRVTTNQATSGVSLRMNGKQILGEEQPDRPEESDQETVVTPSDQTLSFANRVVYDPQWPEAVPEDLLCDVLCEEDLIARSESILDATIDCNLENKRFLDYGCGNGYTALQACLRGVRTSVGFDIKRDPGWDNLLTRGPVLTDDPEHLEPRSFDVILLYDVIDHCETPLKAMKTVYDLLAPGGVVYLRCHPWSSRSGGHLYKQVNKAYAHLALNETLFRRLNVEVEPIRKVIRPLKTYKELFTQSGFRVRKENPVNEAIENFFRTNQEAKNSLLRHWDYERTRDKTLTEAKVMEILQIHFVDYVLQAAGGVM